MKRQYWNILVLTLMAIVVFALSEYIQWYGDSYLYRFHFGTGEPIAGITDIITSQYAHYFSMNGRVWAHVLCQAFSAFWGQTAFALCNAAVYVAFAIALVKASGGTWRSLPQLLSGVLMLLFFTDISYNANCQIGYVWTATVTLAFIILYFRSRTCRSPIGILSGIGLFIIGLLAGDGNEAIAIGVGMALIVDFLLHFRKYTLRQWLLLVGFGIGGLILCLSPGILDRASGEGVNLVWSAYRFLKSSRALYVLIITIAVLKLRGKWNIKTFVADNSFIFTAWLTLLIFNFLIGISDMGRQLFGIELFSAILTLRALKDHAFPKGVIAALGILVTVQYILKFDYLSKSNADLRNLREQIEQSPDMKVYADFQKYPTLVRPTEMTNDRLIYKFCASAIIDDISGYGEYYLTEGETRYSDALCIYPTEVKHILKAPDRSTAVQCTDGMYLMMEDIRYPKKFVLERRIGALGITKPMAEYTCTIPADDPLNFDSVRVDIQAFDMPLVSNAGFRMESK